MATASSAGLTVDDAVVLQDSNKLMVRPLPCDVVARVAPVTQQVAHVEVDVAQQLAASGSPIGALNPRVEPRVHERDGFVVTLWTYYEPVTPQVILASAYADALARLHARMRAIDVPTPHVADHVDAARQLVADRDRRLGSRMRTGHCSLTR